MKEAVEYVVGVVMDELGLTQEEAIDVLAAAVVEVAEGDYELLEKANERIAEG